MPSTFIYVGNLAEMDTVESNNYSENITPVLKTFDHTKMSVVSVTMTNIYDSYFTFGDDYDLGADSFIV